MSIDDSPDWQIQILKCLERLSDLGVPVDINVKNIDHCKVYIDLNCSLLSSQPQPLGDRLYLRMLGSGSTVDGKDHLTIELRSGYDRQTFEQAADQIVQRYDPESDCYYNEYGGSTALIEQTQRYFEDLVVQVEQIASLCTPEQLQAHKDLETLNRLLQQPSYEIAIEDAAKAPAYLQASSLALEGDLEAQSYAADFLSAVESAARHISRYYQSQGRPAADLSTPLYQWEMVSSFGSYALQRQAELRSTIELSPDVPSPQTPSAQQASSDVLIPSNQNAEVNAPVNPTQQGDRLMSTEVLETQAQSEPQAEIKPKKSRGKKAPVQETSAPEPPTAEAVLGSEIEAMLNAVEQTLEAPAPEAPEGSQKPAYDMEMGLFKGGANLFLKEEHREAAVRIAAELGVEVKNTKHGNPYLTVSADQIDQALDLVKASGLSADDARPRAAERAEARAEARREAYAEKAKAQEELRFEGAGSMLIQASLQLMKAGKTFVPGQELDVYQTKASQDEQAKIAEARAQGKDVKEKPIEIGVYDKRAKMVIAKGTVGRDDKGQPQIHVSLDQIAKANRERPDNLQITPPTRAEVMERMDKYVQQRAEVAASKPVLKAKGGVER